MSFDHKRDASGRIIVPVEGPNVPGNPNRQTMRLGLVGGRRADTDPTVAPISDVNNFVMLPDGSGMRVRDGFVFTQKYPIQTSPVGRIAYMIDAAPANLPISFRHMALPTAGALPYIFDGEYIRDRSQALGSDILANISFENETQVASIFPLSTLVQINRAGDMKTTVTFKYRTRNGTALAGVDYTAVDTTGASTANGIGFVGFSVTGGSGKYFYVDLYEAGAGAIIVAPQTIVITIP